MRVVLRLMLVVLCCVLLVPAVAQAKLKPSPTQVAVVGADSDFIYAELSSPGKGCLRERTVRLTVLGTGTVFKTITVHDGSFSIALADIPFGTAAIRFNVAPIRVGGSLCERDTSTVLTFDQATLTGGPSEGAFRGVLSSNVDACEPGRLISLYEISSDPVFVGFNYTDASGAWTIAQAGGTYEARADTRLLGSGDAYTYCKPVVSPPWTFEEPPEESAA